MRIFLLVGAGGALGSVLRYIISVLSHQYWGNTFPLGTLFVNITGAFFLGWFSKKIIQTRAWSPSYSSAIGSGFIGSYTTFSTLSTDFMNLLQQGYYGQGLSYIAFSLLGGLSFAIIGSKLGEIRLLKRDIP